MAQVALLVASLAVSAMQTAGQNRAARQQQQARDEATRRQVQELTRQQERENLVAQEKKSDAALEADRRVGEIVAMGADGGFTIASVARLSSAVAGMRGIDTARIESNRVEDAMARRSAQISLIEENQAAAQQTLSNIRNNKLKLLGTAIGTGMKAYDVMGSSADSSSISGWAGSGRGNGW